MSEQAPERPAGGRGGDFFTQKYGPLPVWAWLLAGAGIGYLIIRRRSAQAASAATTSGASASYPQQPFDYGPSIATIQSEVQNLQSGEAQEGQAVQPPGTPKTMPAVRAEPFNTVPRPGTAGAAATAQQYTGPRNAPYSTVASYLQGRGYTVTSVTRGGQTVIPSGNQIVSSVTPYSNMTARIGLQ